MDEAPEVASVREQLDRLTERLRREAGTALALQVEHKRTIDQKLARFPRSEQTLLQLQREVQVNAEAYEMLMRKHQEALIKEADKVQELSIVESATRATAVHAPGRLLRSLVGLLVGLLLGLVGAFVAESLDTSIGSIEDVEEYLGLSVIGVVPHIETDQVRLELVQRNPALAAEPGSEGLSTLVTQFAPHPIFVIVGGQPIRTSRRSAQWCLDAVNQCWTQKKARTAASEREEAQKAYDHARQAYERLRAECERE